MSKTPPKEFTLKQIRDAFELAAIPEAQSPAVGRRKEGGWYIRVLMGLKLSGSEVTSRYDYFYLDPDGTITTAPRGYTKDYRPGRVADMDEMAALARACGEPFGRTS